MAAGSKPPELLRRLGIESQHADSTGSGLEFGRGTSRPGSQGNGRSHERMVESIAEFLAALARFKLQPANSRLVLLPDFAQCFTPERLWRHQQRRQFSQL